MERGSAKHGPRLDEHQKQESEGIVRGGGTSHAEEWKEPEPTERPGEKDLAPPPEPPGHERGSPQGISPTDVERRSNLAKWLSDANFPAGRDALLAHAEGAGAPDAVLEAVRALPELQYANVSEVAQALGLGVETRRT
ncbi:hypothetical protein C1I98_22370 [Spongiactinospora gelatinilytica]|uniref:DUF2795 domain-containing protein n=1 Tax=Spongiactinospora gelatinilytica TaxID=2666298 RepID=A0A2W2FU22_9ACTN|nr:DUF2795 domain-containing protein [Spongiactinospora gelatinilytica]PZG40926.1 hypothetical protein C1I98_22370 [Spongiactinospora gelatinilytica]